MMNRPIVRWLLLALVVLSVSAASYAQVFVSVRIGPPPLPVYAQPICPGPGYFWTPGYWAWNDDAGYYWVPGTWVIAPVGMLWTPGYWGWGGGFYAWHPGYWGPHVGFYGGINYGFGYSGVGFYGGEWRGRSFYYNRSVTNVSVTNVTNVYNRTVIVNNRTVNNVSYNGGNGGVMARPTPREVEAEHERHSAPLSAQTQHERIAGQNRQNFAAENHGRPAIAATARPGDFSGRAVVPARAAGGEYHPPAMSPRQARVVSSENRGSSPGNKGNSNGGYRSFNPPAKGEVSHGNNRTGDSGVVNRSNEGRSREFTPPNNSHPSHSQNERESRPYTPPQSHPQMHESAPQRRAEPQPQRSSPPPPHKQNAPRDEHRGKGR